MRSSSRTAVLVVLIWPAWSALGDVQGPPLPELPSSTQGSFERPQSNGVAELLSAPADRQGNEVAAPQSKTQVAATPTRQSAALPAIENKGLGRPAPLALVNDGVASGVVPARSGAAASLLEAGSWERTLGSLALVLGLIFVATRVLRKVSLRQGLAGAMGAGGRAPAGVLEVLARYPIARGQSLVLLRLDRRVMLCCHTHGGKLGAGGGMTVLTELHDPEEVASILVRTRDASSESISRRFQSILSRSEHDADRHLAGGATGEAIRPSGRRQATALVTPRALPKGEAGRAAAYGIESATTAKTSVASASGADAADAIRRRLAAMRSGGVTA